jgi:hypothetical protein
MRICIGDLRQQGQATIEYLYVLPILLLLFLGSMQIAFIYEAKLTLNYATFAATRAGALNNGAMVAIQSGLASGLAPLFSHGVNLGDLKAARHIAKTELGDPKLTLIQILNPTQAAMGFGTPIPNDNLMYRDPTVLYGGMNVQDANLLKVRVTYCVRLVVPLVNRMIYAFGLSSTSPTDNSYDPKLLDAQGIAMAAGASGLCVGDTTYPYRLAVSSEAVVRMQSPFTAPGGLKNGGWSGP